MRNRPPTDPGEAQSPGMTGKPAAAANKSLWRKELSYLATNITCEVTKKLWHLLKACQIPSTTGTNNSINPKLIPRMFVYYAKYNMKETQLCCSDQVWLCLLNHRASFSPQGKITKAKGCQWWTKTRKTLSQDNCSTAQIRWRWNCIH